MPARCSRRGYFRRSVKRLLTDYLMAMPHVTLLTHRMSHITTPFLVSFCATTAQLKTLRRIADARVVVSGRRNGPNGVTGRPHCGWLGHLGREWAPTTRHRPDDRAVMRLLLRKRARVNAVPVSPQPARSVPGCRIALGQSSAISVETGCSSADGPVSVRRREVIS